MAGDDWFVRGRNCFVLHDSAEQGQQDKKTAGGDTGNVSVAVLHNVISVAVSVAVLHNVYI